MRKIIHLPDGSFYSQLISALDFDNDTLIYNELTDEMFRFVKPTDTNQTFDTWKDNIPKYNFQHIGGGITTTTTFNDLENSYENYDSEEIFSSDLSSKFMLDMKVYWQKKIGGTGTDQGMSIAVDNNGNVYLNGEQESDTFGYYDYGVVKLDTNGTLLWQKKIGGTISEYATAIAVDSSGNVYLNGYQNSDSYGGHDYGVIKLDTNGNLLWQKKIGGINYDYGQAISLDNFGNVYVTGRQDSDVFGGSQDYGVVKLDTNGNLLWQKKIGGTGQDQGYAITVDSNKNVYLGGIQSSDMYGGSFDIAVIKLDTNGNLLWQKKIGGTGNDYCYGIAVDSFNNVYLNGYQNSDSSGIADMAVIKLDTNGNLLWQKKIGGNEIENGKAIAIDSNDNIYLNGGQNSDSYGGYDYGVIKLDSDGNILWQKKIGGISGEAGYAIAVDTLNNVYLNGYQFSDSYGGKDYGVMKLYTDQDSDMSLSIGDMNLSIGNMSLSIGDMNLSIGNMSLSIGDMNLSIGDINMSGETGGLTYIG